MERCVGSPGDRASPLQNHRTVLLKPREIFALDTDHRLTLVRTMTTPQALAEMRGLTARCARSSCLRGAR